MSETGIHNRDILALGQHCLISQCHHPHMVESFAEFSGAVGQPQSC
jgi:hypothetical protein